MTIEPEIHELVSHNFQMMFNKSFYLKFSFTSYQLYQKVQLIENYKC